MYARYTHEDTDTHAPPYKSSSFVSDRFWSSVLHGNTVCFVPPQLGRQREGEMRRTGRLVWNKPTHTHGLPSHTILIQINNGSGKDGGNRWIENLTRSLEENSFLWYSFDSLIPGTFSPKCELKKLDKFPFHNSPPLFSSAYAQADSDTRQHAWMSMNTSLNIRPSSACMGLTLPTATKKTQTKAVFKQCD